MDFPEHPFWDFALRVYRTPGVSEDCLEVQERLGVDVNFLLFCLWVGESGSGTLSREKIARAHDAVSAWHESVVKRLRAVRRVLKEGVGAAQPGLATALRAQIQAREIDAEHIEQLMLVESVGSLGVDAARQISARADDAIANIAAYLAGLNVAAGAADRAALGRIVKAAFPDIAAEHAERQFSSLIPAAY